MNITFSRIDYAQVGTTSTKCLQVIRAEYSEKKSKKSKSDKVWFFIIKQCFKIVIGAQNGILMCLERNKGETNVIVYF